MKTATLLLLLLVVGLSLHAAPPAISPTTIKFDPEAADRSDLTVRLSLNGSRLTGVRIGLASLVADRDYTVKGDRVTIRRNTGAGSP